MKKILLSLAVALTFGSTQAQNLFSFGFDGTTEAMDAAGWARTNQSGPATATLWSIPNAAPATTFAGGGQAGGPISFALVNFTSVGVLTPTGATGSGTISNWLISPIVTVQNGDVVSFYTRIGRNSTTGQASFPDNLELRMSANGAFTANPSTGPADVADFTTLLVAVNPTLNLTAYPLTWGLKSATISGLDGPTDVKFAFRYFVPNGGNDGANSDIIGIDTFSVDRALATEGFFSQNFEVYPNPSSDVLNINAKSNTAITEIQLTDVNGRTVKTVKANETTSQINISDLNAGVYFLKVTSNLGSGTTKVVKN